MRILGIDPGTGTTGFGIIDVTGINLQLLDFGCIKTSQLLSAADRLHQIAEDFKSIMQQWNPQTCAIEKIFFAKNIKTAIKVAEARGVLLQNARKWNLDIYEYSPSEVKIAVTSDGQADKKQVQKMVQLILNLNYMPEPDDAADALAIALCHAQSMKIRSLERR
ncbi:crossover junction endodeoxyribonuclease RuvC [Candidatus Peregrinibacteria bacterium]|nr:crossover junction endodeoxyribonuclease RuvC [Candidatus Peregrinibacteria bacterium]